VLVGLLGLLALALWATLNSSMLVTQGLKHGLPKANAAIPGTIVVGRSEGPLRDLVLHEVEILDETGLRAVYVERLELEWGLLDLLARRIAVDRVTIVNPEVWVRLGPDKGGVNLAAAFVDRSKPKKPKKGASPLLKALKGSADVISVTGASVYVETPGGRPVDLQGVDLEAVWTMDRLVHDVQLTRLSLDMVKPLPLAGLAVAGGVGLKPDLTLDLSDIAVAWREARLGIDGSVGRLNDLDLALDVAVAHLDLVDVKEIAAKAPLEGTLSGEIAIGGKLKEELTFRGALVAGDGAGIGLDDVRLRLPGGEREALEYDADLSLVALSPEYFVTGVEGLPADLDLEIQWSGGGTTLDTLRGELIAVGEPFDYRQMTIGPLRVDAALDGPVITTRSMDIGLGGGEIHVAGTTDVRQQSYALDLDGMIANLGVLRGVSNGLVRGGVFSFDGFSRGTWGGDGPYPFSTHTKMDTTARLLQLAPVAIGAAQTSFEIDLDLVPGGLPLLHGTLNTTAERIATSQGEQARSVQAGLALQGASTLYTVTAGRGADLIVDSTGLVEWGDLPRIGIRGDTLEITAGEQTLVAKHPFAVALRSGALSVQGLEIATSTGTLVVDASYDPKAGTIAGEATVRTLDLSEVEPLATVFAGRSDRPLNHLLGGVVKELEVVVGGTLAAPTATLTSSVRGLTGLDRSPQDVELEVNVGDGQITGFVEISNLLTLQLTRVPVGISLDGSGPVARIAPELEWDVELTIDRNELSTIADLAAVALPELVEGGTYDGLVALEGTTAELTARARARLSGLDLADHSVSAAFGATLKDGQLDVMGSRLKADGQTIVELTGGAGAPVGELLLARLGPVEGRHDRPLPFLVDLELRAELQKLEMSLLHVFAESLKPLTGALTGHVEVTGELNAPEIESDVRLLGARAGKQELHPVQVTAAVVDGVFTSGFAVRPKRGGVLQVTASAPFPLRLQPLTPREELLGQDGLDVTLKGEGFPMPVLLAFVPDIWESAGVLTISGGVTGSILQPIPRINLNVDDGLICYKRTGICYEQVTLNTRVDPGKVALKELSFDTVPQVVNPIDMVRGGRGRTRGQRQGFTATGTASLDGLTLGEIDLELNFERMWALYTNEFQAQLHSPVPLTIRGTLPALDIRGHLELQNVDVDLGQDDVAARDIQRLMLPGNLHVHRESTPFGPGERVVLVFEEDTGPTFAQRFMRESTLDVTVTLTNNVHVALNAGVAALTGDNTEAGQVADIFGNIKPDLTLEGEVKIELRNGAPFLQGEIHTGRGSELTVLTKKFTVRDGSTLTFIGLIRDTQLDVTAIYPSNYGDVRVVVTKAITDPQIDFESDELEDPADIMSVLITGKPLSEVGTSEGNAAASIIANGLTGFFTGAFGKYVPVDSLDFDLGDDLSSFSVEAGKAITPFIFFIARYNHGVEDDENRVEGELEIRIDRNGYVEFRIGDRLEGSAEVVGKVIF